MLVVSITPQLGNRENEQRPNVFFKNSFFQLNDDCIHLQSPAVIRIHLQQLCKSLQVFTLSSRREILDLPGFPKNVGMGVLFSITYTRPQISQTLRHSLAKSQNFQNLMFLEFLLNIPLHRIFAFTIEDEWM
ncbi:MAG: hypothetical protein ACFCU8_10495 [Thermosynechococcaceae cyanobacterium]